ncbi:MAG: 4-phosphoerythronate dehydrogenase [Balneolaceae bacterium]|nr:4-phosphoerythronate dehydrogenase [Balneolaceae bacterium]
MITVFADKYLYNIEELLPESCSLKLYNPSKGLPENLDHADALLIRTVTEINRDLINRLPESMKFIGTGSAGTDHVNVDLLKEKDIAFADAAGCNSRSVAEYVATALLLWMEDSAKTPESITVGIIGKGHAGSEVHSLLENLGIDTVCYDPPKEKREQDFTSASLEEVMSTDILTFHTPLEHRGVFSTYHWLDEEKLDAHKFDLIINTSRGGVIDEQALLKSFIRGSVGDFIIDVWENEPLFNDLIAENAFIKTPHIAGYSRQSKLRATQMIVDALCRHFEIDQPEKATNAADEKLQITNNSLKSAQLTDVLCKMHPIKEYENGLKRLIGLPPQKKGPGFNTLRSEFPLRTEFRYLNIPDYLSREFPVVQKLGS